MMTRARQNACVLLLLLPLATAAGCGGSSDNVSLPGPDPTTLVLSQPTPDGLTASLMQDKATVPVTTNTVTYTLTLANRGQAPVSLSVPQDANGNALPPAALSVRSSGGEAVYPTGAAPAPPVSGTRQTLTLQPGDFVQQTLQLTNAFRVVDRYQATATFTTSGGQTVVGPLTLTAR